jgi:hypothetical protein
MEMMMAVSLAIIAFCMLMIMAAAVATLLRIRKVAMEAERLVETVRMNLPPLIHDVTKITSDLRSIVHTVERQRPSWRRRTGCGRRLATCMISSACCSSVWSGHCSILPR